MRERRQVSKQIYKAPKIKDWIWGAGEVGRWANYSCDMFCKHYSSVGVCVSTIIIVYTIIW